MEGIERRRWMVSESVGGEARVRAASGGPDEVRLRSFAGRFEGESSTDGGRECCQ